jgi:hypothetical protein
LAILKLKCGTQVRMHHLAPHLHQLAWSIMLPAATTACTDGALHFDHPSLKLGNHLL